MIIKVLHVAAMCTNYCTESCGTKLKKQVILELILQTLFQNLEWFLRRGKQPSLRGSAMIIFCSMKKLRSGRMKNID